MIDKIDFWTSAPFHCPITDASIILGNRSTKAPQLGLGKNKTLIVNYQHKLYEQFLSYYVGADMKKYNAPLNWKVMGQDEVDPNRINLIASPGMGTQWGHIRMAQLLERSDVIQFAKDNNVTIIMPWLFELYMCGEGWGETDPKSYNQFLRDFKELITMVPPRNFQYIMNSYDKTRFQHDAIFRPYITHIDAFDKIAIPAPVLFDPYQEHTYKLSFPVGTLIQRWSRVDSMIELIRRNILMNKDVIYTVNCLNPVRDMEWFKTAPNAVREEKNREFALDYGIEKIFKNVMYNSEGERLTKENFSYEKERHWFATPPQFLDSQFQFVIESRIHAPSITEKVYRPLSHGQPFVWMAYPHLKQYLESKGYKFYPWIDYSFDSIENEIKRFYAVMDEIERLYHMDLKELLIESEEISIHNSACYLKNSNDTSDMDNFLLNLQGLK